MKLGEALSERARLQRRIGELRDRINANTMIREGEKTAESAADLLDEAVRTTQTLEELIVRINLTNARTSIDGMMLTEWLAKRDSLASLATTYNGAAGTAQQQRDRNNVFGRSEFRTELTVDVPSLRAQADAALDEMRRVDNKIQEANWATEV